MRPFGNNITNRANNTGNNGNNNNNENNNDGNNQNNADNSNVNNNNTEDDNEVIRDPRVPAYIQRIGGTATVSKTVGLGVIRVVERCEGAKENNDLDLSECQLVRIPEAVYHLMRNTEIKTCNLSGNTIKKITPIFTNKFSQLTDLNLSSNKIVRLPEELSALTLLANLNISYNSFITFPAVVFKMLNLRTLDASHNSIVEIDTEQMITSEKLESVDLSHNPLCNSTRQKIRNANPAFNLVISEPNEADEDWLTF